MTPLHFGSTHRRLFGIYDPAKRLAAKSAVVLCHPLGNEQVFAYRMMRQLAVRLSGAGHHVMRFDYYATGDSYGDEDEGDEAGWCDDIGTAIDEIKDMTGATALSLVGLRHGANLCAKFVAHNPDVVSKLVLWDPVGDEPHVHLSEAGLQQHATTKFVLLTSGMHPADIVRSSPTLAIVADHPAWIEDRLTTGSLPAEAIQRVVDWLR